MNKIIAKGFYETVVIEGIEEYEYLLDNTIIDKETNEYWCNFLCLYHNLSDKQKSIFIRFIKQIIIDTISHVFGIIDGPCTFSVPNTEFKLYINGVDSDMEMQDSFLEYVELHDK